MLRLQTFFGNKTGLGNWESLKLSSMTCIHASFPTLKTFLLTDTGFYIGVNSIILETFLYYSNCSPFKRILSHFSFSYWDVISLDCLAKNLRISGSNKYPSISTATVRYLKCLQDVLPVTNNLVWGSLFDNPTVIDEWELVG